MYENQIEIAGSLKIETSVGGHARKGLLLCCYDVIPIQK